MKEEKLYGRGQSNIEDAHFIRENFIPIALEHEKWNVVVHQSYQALELLIKGMICLTGQTPRKDHRLDVLLDDLLRAIPPTSKGSSIKFALFASTSNEGNGFGLWFQDDYVSIFKCIHGTYTAMGNFAIEDHLKADKILRLELELQNSTVRLSLDNEPLLLHTDSSFTGPLTLKREIVREPSNEKVDLLKDIGQKLKATREGSFYSEQTYTKTEAEEAIQLFDQANEAAAYFFIDVSEFSS